MVVARKRAGKTTHYATFRWQGKRVWENAGTDAREADRLEKRRKKEVTEGRYMPSEPKEATTVRQFAKEWLAQRTNRTASDDRSRIELHVLSRAWLADKPIASVTPPDLLRLVQELNVSVSEATGKTISSKMVANIYGSVRTMFRAARFNRLTTEDPCVLPKGSVSPKSKVRRTPYSVSDMLRLTGDAVEPDRRVWNAIAFYTGMREGEVCGRRWRDLDMSVEPLGCLTVTTQYKDRPLKTDDANSDHPRAIPVHQDLAEILTWWWAEGFEFVYCRKPREDDFIVPRRSHGGREPHTKSSAYKGWRKSCDEALVVNKTLHATRNTFISLARRGGARKDVVERVTHNASGDIVDAYTTWDWIPLCEAVASLTVDVPLTPIGLLRKKVVEAPGIEAGAEPPPRRTVRNFATKSPHSDLRKVPRELRGGTSGAARQRLTTIRESLGIECAIWDAFDAFAAAEDQTEHVAATATRRSR